MRTTLWLACFSLSVLSAPSWAEEATARVRAIYHEAAQGLVEGSVHSASAARWAEVELERDGRRMLVHLPTQMQTAVGDRVGVQIVHPNVSRLAALHRDEVPAVHASRVTEVHARGASAGVAVR